MTQLCFDGQLTPFHLVLNPQLKFSWLKKHWNPDEQGYARTWILDSVCCVCLRRVNAILTTEQMTKYRATIRCTETPTAIQSSASTNNVNFSQDSSVVGRSLQSQFNARQTIRALKRELSSAVFSTTASSSSITTNDIDDPIAKEKALLDADCEYCEHELDAYLAERLETWDEPDGDVESAPLVPLNLVSYWEVSSFFFRMTCDLMLNVGRNTRGSSRVYFM